MTLDENGNIYGSYWGVWGGSAGTRVSRIRPDGSTQTLVNGLNHPNGISYRDGKIYFANGSNQVYEADTNGNVIQTYSVIGPSNVLPVPGVPDSLVAVSYNQSRLSGIGPSGTTSITFGAPINGPAGMAYDESGILYIANYNNGRILKYNGNGSFSTLADIGGGIGFITYSDSAILATNHSDHKIYRVSLDGTNISVIAGSGQIATLDGVGSSAAFNMPNGIVSTPSGDTIYVSEFISKAVRRIVRTTATNITPGSPIKTPEIYPVPAKDRLNLNHPEDLDPGIFQIYDLNGSLLQSSEKVAGERKSSIELDAIPSGIYQLIVLDSKATIQFQKKISVLK